MGGRRKEGMEMRGSEYSSVCYRTDQHDERVPLRNLKTGELGYSFECSYEKEGISVELSEGGMDTWGREECVEEG